ncbi:MAG TPA: CpsD/CapB family tyrosine-protein kinase [Azospira sp.]|nr:CpsD/CapB family tyrosine-protein kinase [Azospira sp.]
MKIDTFASESSMASPRLADANHGNSIGAILISLGKLKPESVPQVMALQQREGCRFGDAAKRLRLIDDEDLRQALRKQYDLPTLAPSSEVSRELVSVYAPDHSCTEELRALRTQLLVRWYRPSKARRVLALLSPGAGEGRSYVAANLAVLFSQLGERTLLIDADFRKPRQHLIFDMEDRIGLSSVLAGRADHSAATAVPGFPNLMLLTAGAPPPNPLEQLSRPTFSALLNRYATAFDVILIDTAPGLQYTDAQAVGYQAGNALVITRRSHTRVADTARLVKGLGDSGVRVVGSVINDC